MRRRCLSRVGGAYARVALGLRVHDVTSGFRAYRTDLLQALDLDAVVDDTPENCIDIATESRARVILVWRGPDSPPDIFETLSISVVTSAAASLDLLQEDTTG